MHFRKDLYFQKNNRGRHVLYCCSAHAFWSPFPRKGLRFHKNNRENNRGQGVLYCCSWYDSWSPFPRKDLRFHKNSRENNRGQGVLYCCSAHASWSPFPRKDLCFHKNSRGQSVLYCCSGYASLLPHQSDLQRRQKNRQKKSFPSAHCHKPQYQLFYIQEKPFPPLPVSALCSQPDSVSLHKQEKGHPDLPVRYYPYGPDDRHQSQNYHQLSAHLRLPSPLCDLYSKNHSIRNNEFRSFFPFPSVFQPFSVSFLT